MMAQLYCLCEAENAKPESQAFGARNRYARLDSWCGPFPPVALYQPMKMIAVGVPQVLLNDPQPNDWSSVDRPVGHRHYPNVDIWECPNCRARIAR